MPSKGGLRAVSDLGPAARHVRGPSFAASFDLAELEASWPPPWVENRPPSQGRLTRALVRRYFRRSSVTLDALDDAHLHPDRRAVPLPLLSVVCLLCPLGPGLLTRAPDS